MHKPTAIDFTKVSKRTLDAILVASRFSDQNKDIAKAVLLDGESIPTLAETYGITAVAIYRMLRTIKDRISTTGEVSADDWVSVKVELPQVIAHELHLWATQIKRASSPRTAANAITAVQTALLKSRSAVIAGK